MLRVLWLREKSRELTGINFDNNKQDKFSSSLNSGSSLATVRKPDSQNSHVRGSLSLV